MRVFVLSTGRCGSLTFAAACGHFTNYTAGHETRTKLIGPDLRYAFPDNHIESDNHFALQTGQLDERFGDEPFYVHLRRDPSKVAASYARLFDGKSSNPRAYAMGSLMRNRIEKHEVLPVCEDFVATAEANIRMFLATKSKTLTIDIDSAKESFAEFARRIGAKGDIEAALQEFDVRQNPKVVTTHQRRKERIRRTGRELVDLVLGRI